MPNVVRPTDSFGQIPDETIPSPRISTVLTPSLLARFSHEVRTQLTSLRYISDYLSSSTDESNLHWRSLQLLDQNVAVLERLITDLFLVSEWEDGNFHLRREKLNFEEFIWSVLGEARGELETAGIRLRTMIAGLGEGAFLADAKLLRWALLQLIRNSLQYGQTTETVQIAARREKKYVDFHIHDDGRGITPQELPYIFERFFRGEASRAASDRQEIRGLGQGLYFARAIAEAHGGSLEAASEPGNGAHFSMRIPIIEMI